MTNDHSLHLSSVEGKPWPEHIPSLWESFVECATKYPDSPAISSVYQSGAHYGLPNLPLDDHNYQSQPYLRWSQREFSTAVARLAKAFTNMGLHQGSVIITFVPNCAEFPVLIWASICLGCTLVPIHPRTLRNKEEAMHIITLCIDSKPNSKHTVIAGDDDVAKQVQALKLIENVNLVVFDTASSTNEWTSFADLMDAGLPADHSTLTKDNPAATHSHLILFTSGTTALPKGCDIDSLGWALWCQNRLDSVPVTTDDCCLLTVPNNHALYWLFELPFRTTGGHTVIPAPSFSPLATTEVILKEKCTHLAASPTMIHAIIQAMTETQPKLTSLKNVTSGGSKISVEFLNSCLSDLGSAGVENFYGSTEGCICASTRVVNNIADVTRDGDIAVGRVVIGASIKVCAIGSRDPLPCGTEGELHFSSRIMCKGYLGVGLTDDFYEDEAGRLWFATGDAATVNEEGLVFIIGRLKDMIIRGGVNISPAAIEFVLQKDDATKAFNIQIVGVPDVIAGEVPVAVSERQLTPEEILLAIDTVLKNMGPVFVPEEVISLETLGLSDFPKTTSTKHQKGKLQEIVTNHINQRSLVAQKMDNDYSEMTRKVQKVWTRTIGHAVDVHADVTEFADSITLMRVRDRLQRETGVAIPLADMLTLKTVEDQIQILQKTQKATTVDGDTAKLANNMTSSHKPDTGTDLVGTDLLHLKSTPQFFESTRTFIESKISQYGLSWSDINSVYPASDFVQVLTQAHILNESWSWKFCCLANKGMTKEQMRKGVEIMLANNPLLTSFLFWNRKAFGHDIALYVSPRASDKLFETIFTDLGSVATKQEFAQMALKPYEYEHAVLPGPLIKCFMVDVADVERAGCVMVMSHAGFDATYMQNVFDDLDMALGFSMPLDPHISLKTWADSYYSLRNSHEAQVAVSWHVNRLNNLVECKAGVFPPLPKTPTRIQATDDNGYHTSFEATGMTNLRRKYPHVGAPTVMKAAWCLMNLNRTNHDHAIFSNLQADRRKFPFIPAALEALAPPDTFSASNVGGLTLQDVVNIIQLLPNENVVDFMTRIHRDQEEINKYAAAPMKHIMSEIGGVNSEIFLDILRSQIFNWTTGLGALESGNPNENYEPVASAIRPSLRLVINVDVAGEKNETVYMQIKSPLFDEDGLKAIADEVEDFTLWLVKEENWEMQMDDFRDALRANKKSLLRDSGVAFLTGEGVERRTTKAHIL